MPANPGAESGSDPHSDYLFLLGGGDLEMTEIRRLLDRHGQPYHDRGLAWGAALSAYQGEISAVHPGTTLATVELKQDWPLPVGLKMLGIDHHDQEAGRDRPTSLEQVAALLGHELDRRQRLIAANDRGHIPAMKALGATEEEIMEIRAADRQAQGVTAEDEGLARESLKMAEEFPLTGTVLVESLTEKTSPLVDSLCPKYTHVFILTPTRRFFYFGQGKIVAELKARYDQMGIERKEKIEYWSGGDLPERGFFGSGVALPRDEILDLTGKVISHHIFLFPFTIDSTDRDIFAAIGQDLPDGWSSPAQSELDMEANQNYSEFFYFHKFARETYFRESATRESDQGKSRPRQYDFEFRKYRLLPSARFNITVTNYDGPKKYSLEIAQISLRLFGLGLGVLGFELVNRSHDDIEDIIAINDRGRRLYPQFLGRDDGVAAPKASFWRMKSN